MNFHQLELEYRRLRAAYQAGEISAKSFEKQVNALMVVDQGTRWMIGVNSGRWYRHDGNRWIEDNPPASTEIYAPAQDQQTIQTETEETVHHTPSTRPQTSTTGAESRSQKKPGRILMILIPAFLVMALLTWGILILTQQVAPPAFLAVLLSPVTATAENNAVTPSQPAPTETPLPTITTTTTSTPIPVEADLTGEWIAAEGSASYHFYPDSSFVYFDPVRNEYNAGRYARLPENQIEIEVILGETSLYTLQHELVFQDENTFRIQTEDVASTWLRNGMTLADTRFKDPIALLYELSYRLDMDFPNLNCGFDEQDDSSEFTYVCLSLDDGLSMTWVDQALSNDPERNVERNLLTVRIDHQDLPAYEEQWGYTNSQMAAIDSFHGLPAYSATTNMDWFIIDEFAWQDGPWLYSIFRLNALSSPHPAPGLLFTAETLYEIQQGLPPQSSPTTIPTERPEGAFRYSEGIIGTWQLQHPTTEIIEFFPDGTITISSELGRYAYTGTYYFTSDERITFVLESGTVKAGIQLDGDVLTLSINGVLSVYDRATETEED